MAIKQLTYALALTGGLALAGPIWAQEGTETVEDETTVEEDAAEDTTTTADDGTVDDIEMEVVDDPGAGERELTENIELPETASPEGRENSAKGLETANEARQRAAERQAVSGRETATEARERAAERGRGVGREAAAEARESSRDATRARDRGNRPEGAGRPSDRGGRGNAQ